MLPAPSSDILGLNEIISEEEKSYMCTKENYPKLNSCLLSISFTTFKIFGTKDRNIRNAVFLFQMIPQFSKLHLPNATNALDFSLRWDVSFHNGWYVHCSVVRNGLTSFCTLQYIFIV